MADLRVIVDLITRGERNLHGLASGLDTADRKADSMQRRLGGIPPVIGAVGGALAAAGIANVLGDAADEASGLAEAQGKVNVVFGDGAPALNEWAEGASQIGLSRRDALEAVGTYGNLFRAFGVGQDEAQGMSQRLVELAADMASFNNTSIDDALVALRSGLSGETEPLKRYGVALNDARLRQKAMELGIYDGVGALNVLQKSQAAYNLILQDTTLTQGDFIRTSDGLANSQRRVQAEIDNAMASIGAEVASIQLGAIRVAEFLNQEFNPWEPVAERWNEDFGNVLAAVGEFVTGHKEKIDFMPTDAMRAAHQAAENVHSEMVKGGPVIAAEAGKIAGMLPSAIQDQVDDIRQAGMDSVVAFAAGLLEKQNDPMLAWDAMLKANEDALTRQEEITRLQGMLQSTELATGLNDGRPEVRLAAQAVRAEIVDRLRTLDAWQWGHNVGSSLAKGMEDAAVLVRQQAVGLSSLTGGAIRIESEPDDPRSGLRGITTWGANIVDTMASGITHRLSVAQRASQALSEALSPSVSTGVQGLQPSAALVGSGDHHTHIHLTYSGSEPANENDLVALLKQVAPFVDGRLRAGA